MITDQSATKLADDIIRPYITAGVANEGTIGLVARIILQHLEMDELKAQIAKLEQPKKTPRFDKVYCSQCGGEFGPRDSGYSHCRDHRREAA